jgi:plastocyanin
MLKPLVFLALVSLILAACSGGDNKPSPTTTASSTTPAATEGEPAAAATVPFTPAARGPATFHVLAGATDGAFDIEQFMPQTIHIRAGDSITWTAQGYEGHTVTFFPDGKINIGPAGYLVDAADTPGTREFNPLFALGSDAQGSYDGTQYTNSGFFGVPAPADYSLTFPKAGSYSYICMVHPINMRGVIVVDEAAAQVPSPDDVAAQAATDKDRYAKEAKAAAAEDRARRVAESAASGGHTFQVSVGLDTPHAQVLAFTPGVVDLKAGDKVVFWNSERDFHNVIFAPDGTAPPQFPILKPVDGKLGFRLLINPDAEHEIAPPAGFGPETLFSSGLMGIGFPRFYYEVTFAKPGTYKYYCTVHTLAGMSGTINVQ